ncbi:MAG: M48 family metallopeptidase [Dictyoglomus sp.]
MLLWIFLVLLVGKALFQVYLSWRNLRYAQAHSQILPVFKDLITKEDFEKSKNYLRDNTIFGFIVKSFDLVFNLVFVFILYPYIERVVVSLTDSFILQGLFFFGIFGLINLILSIPFDIYETFVLEEKYGFNTTTPKIFILDIIKSIIISIILGAPLLAFLLYLIKVDPNFWWKFALTLIFFELFIYFIYPLVIAPLFNKFTPLEEGELKDKIVEIAEKVGFKISNVFVMDASRRTKKQNAYLTGFGKSRRVVLYDTILSYPQDEILAIFAHELGHHRRGHLPKLLALSVLFYVLYIYSTFLVYKNASLSRYFGIQKEFTLLVYAFIFTSSLFYFINPFVNAISRKFEYEADAFSARILRNPYPLINALKRLVKENLSNIYPDPLFRTWYYSHPAPSERIYALLSLEKGENKDEDNDSSN